MNQARLLDELRCWVPTYGHGRLAAIPGVEQTIVTAVDELLASMRAALPVVSYATRESLGELERMALERRLEEKLLDVLIDRAVLPRYAFPTDVVSFWVSKETGKTWSRRRLPQKLEFDYEPQRDLQIALSEYAPGASLTIDKKRFTSAAIYSPYEPGVSHLLDRAQHYAACRACGWVSLEPEPNDRATSAFGTSVTAICTARSIVAWA